MMDEYYRNLDTLHLYNMHVRHSPLPQMTLRPPRDVWIRAIRGSEVARHEIIRGTITLIRVQVNSTPGNRV